MRQPSLSKELQEEQRVIDDAQLRRWLTLLHRPDQLSSPEITELLKAHGRLPSSSSSLAVGHAAAALLTDMIERLKPAGEADRQQELPHLVLKTCFVKGAKLFQAAATLGLSERQLSRERARAIALLRTEIQAPLVEEAARSYQPEPIPSIRGFIQRRPLANRLRVALERNRLASVQGPSGIGKTSLVAELATEVALEDSVLWYRFRPGVNTSLRAIVFELGEYLGDQGSKELRDYVTRSLPELEAPVATRLALKGLAGRNHLLVFDDYHLVETDASIAGFLDELVVRLPLLRVVTVGRHRLLATSRGETVEVAPFTRKETEALLRQLSVDCTLEMVHTLHSWTEGNTHLVKLAASWLKTAEPDEVSRGVSSLTNREEVQSFLLQNVTELLDSDDQAVLEAASIFRHRCSDEALAHVAARSMGAVLDASLRLVRAYIATRNREGDSAFFHGTVRNYVYQRLEPDRRAELHLRAASWYRKLGDNKEASYHRGMAATAEEELA